MKYKTKRHGMDSLVVSLAEKLDAISVPTNVVSVGMGVSMEDDGSAVKQYGDIATETERTFKTVLEDHPEILASVGVSMEDLSSDAADAMELAGISGVISSDIGQAGKISNNVMPVDEYSMNIGEFNPLGVEVSMESFDEREISKLRSYTMVTNLFAGYGTKFSRSVAPLYTSSPDQSGIQMVIDLMYIQDDTKHEISGVLTNWNRKSLTRAMIDGSILDHNSTDIVPVYRDPENKDLFADIADYPTTVVKVGSVDVTTAPLKPHTSLNIKGISQTDELVASSAMDYSDTIEPDFSLNNIYMDVAGSKIKFNVGAEVTSAFVPSRQSENTGMNLNFDSESVLITSETLDVTGAPLAAPLDEIATKGWTVHLTTSIAGRMDIGTGNMKVYMNETTVHEIVDATGKRVDLKTGAGEAFVGAVNGNIAFEGYDIKGRFSDLNLRHEGTHITTAMYTINHVVGIDPPVRIKRPPSQINAFKDTSRDLQALVNSLNVRSDNKVVRILGETAEKLAIFKKAKFSDESSNPQLFGAGNLFVRPSYDADGIDVAAVINSIRSHDKHKDVRAVISDIIWIKALNLWTDSGLRAAVESLPPGYSKKPTFVIPCDVKLHSLIDMKAYPTEQFDFEVVSSPNKEMIEKAYGFFRFNQQDTPNPLTAFFSVSAPHIVFNNNVSNGGSGAIKMLSVYPRYKVFANTPVLMNLSITNIDAAFTTKIPGA